VLAREPQAKVYFCEKKGIAFLVKVLAAGKNCYLLLEVLLRDNLHY